jgi:NAD(P)-dependent dehydrogenase (short-subunit alcohol dehydrogenase family)
LPPYDLRGKVAVVTGASVGLGVEFAHGLAECGADVALAARREQALRDLARTLQQRYGVRALAVKTDVAKEDDIVNLIQSAVNGFDKVDILVNNAGTTLGKPLLEHTLDDWRRVIDVNLTGTFLTSREAARVMVPKRSGSIINISSVFAFTAVPQFPVLGYYASKGGVTALTKALAVELGKSNIRVNEIAPSFFPSEMSRETFANTPEAEQLRNEMLWPRTALPVLPKPEWIRGALCFLASDEARYVTGHTLAVDGGWLAL